MGLGKRKTRQHTLWVATGDVAVPRVSAFYRRLDRLLVDADFDPFVERLVAPLYHARRGRKSIAPGVYFRLHFIAYFDGIDSERALAARVEDSLSLRAFLGLGITGSTPEASTIRKARHRLGPDIHRAVFEFVAQMLHRAGLLGGDGLAVDASLIRANASRQSLVRRDNRQAYDDWLRGLAREAGLDDPAPDQLKQLDRQRKSKQARNAEWFNPHDPDARIAQMPTHDTQMAYKVEHAVDTTSGALLAVRVMPVAGDTTTGPATVAQARETIARLRDADPGAGPLPGNRVVMDKGYHSAATLATLEEAGCKPVIKEPKRGGRRIWRESERRRRARACSRQYKAKKRRERGAEKRQTRNRKRKGKDKARRPATRAAARPAPCRLTREQKALYANRRRCTSRHAKRLMRRRSELAERSFAHTLDRGGARRTTLRGASSINTRYQTHGAAFNLSVLLRRLHGAGTPHAWALCRHLRILLLLLALVLVAAAATAVAPNPPRCHPRRYD